MSADRDRFEELYTGSRLAVLGYLTRRTHDPADAADMLADVYLTAWRRVADIPSGDGGRLWLFGVARRVLANYRRHRHVENRLADTLRTQLVAQLTGHDLAAEKRSDALRVRIASLKPTDREIIELAAYEELTPAEIAVVIGKSPGAVRVKLHRIRNILRDADPPATTSIRTRIDTRASA